MKRDVVIAGIGMAVGVLTAVALASFLKAAIEDARECW